MSEFDVLHDLVNFGAAGLMGLLWTWERAMSRQRERQLSEAHERLVVERAEISVITDLVERNTRATIRFEETQSAVLRLLEQALHPNPHPAGDIFRESRRPQREAPQKQT